GVNGNNSPGPMGHMRTCLATTPNGLNCVDGSTIIPSNTWMHVAMTYDGSVLRLYLNGTLDGSIVINQPIVTDTITFTMGNNPESYALHGQLDEVRLWSVARSQAQIQATMNTVLTGSEPGLAAYWRLDEGGGGTVYASSPKGYNGR